MRTVYVANILVLVVAAGAGGALCAAAARADATLVGCKHEEERSGKAKDVEYVEDKAEDIERSAALPFLGIAPRLSDAPRSLRCAASRA